MGGGVCLFASYHIRNSMVCWVLIKTKDTIEVARKKERDGSLPRSVPFHVGTDPFLPLRTSLLLDEIGSGYLRRVSCIILSLSGSRF